MSNQSKYKMRLSLNVLNHLGINLYSNIPSVLSEAVANAWDADAENVDIEIQRAKDGKPETIIITDDGVGMSLDDINGKFLLVGYNRRKGDGASTLKGRTPMGRKGIGKLSLFSIADTISVHSVKNGKKHAFQLDAHKIKEMITADGESKERDVPVEEIKFDSTLNSAHGSRIVLTNLKRRIIGPTFSALRKKIARRFSVSCMNEMSVRVDKEQITTADRDYASKLEYVLHYGSEELLQKQCANLANDGWHKRPASFDEEGNSLKNGKYTIHGWLGMTASSKDLVGDGSDNMNKISVFMRGKVAVEDILESFGFSSMFTRFVVGEIHADFLDDDEEEDIATSSRQKIIEDNKIYLALKHFMEKELKAARNIRDDSKRESGTKAATDLFPKIQEWLDEMPNDTRKKARVLLGKINGMNTDTDNKKMMFKIGIQAFQSRRLRDKLDNLNAIGAEDLEGFLRVARELDELEALYYYDITKERLRVIEKLEKMTEDDEKEKVLQRYIFEHLWLLDPSWERAKGTEIMERPVTNAFNKINAELSSEEKRARVDIQYRTAAGAHVIVELKRASAPVNKTNLEAQVLKYQRALKMCLQQAGKDSEPIEIVCVIGKCPANWNDHDTKQKDLASLRAWNIRVLTYQELIANAKQSYHDYLVKARGHEKFISMIADLDDESDEE